MKPMLAAKFDEKRLREHLSEVPLLASAKLDGIRGLIREDGLVSRSLKPLRNHYVQKLLARPEFVGLDGELIVGDPTAPDVYRKTNSAVMSFAGRPDFTFYVFDRHDRAGDFHSRLMSLLNDYDLPSFIKLHPQQTVADYEALLSYEDYVLDLGYEGLIVRRPDRPYKWNRSTAIEGGMMKVKRFLDSEAEILYMEELMHNANEAFENELGRTARSQAMDGKVPMDTLGALVVRDVKTGIEFKIGTGFDEAERQTYWRREAAMKGTLVKYKYFPVGIKDKPRHPVFLGLRDKDDL